jgi:serine/threonine-protein kinase RsbW
VDELVTLDIPARAEYVVLGRLALAGVLRDRPFSQDAVADLKLALTEACSNSIRHAYDKTDTDGQVHLSFSVTAERIVVEVRDEGPGFVASEDAPGALTAAGGPQLSEGGMGISIIRSVVDEFVLKPCESGGTWLTLTKLADA